MSSLKSTPLGLLSHGTIQETEMVTTYKVAEVENKSFSTFESVNEVERILKMAKDTDECWGVEVDIWTM